MRLSLAALLLPALADTTRPADPPAVTPARVEERRVKDLEQTNISAPKAGRGPGATGERRRIRRPPGRAVAGRRGGRRPGTDLRPDDKSRPALSNAELVRAYFDPAKDTNFPATVTLKPAARGATRLARVRGTLTVLVGGDPRAATFPKLGSLAGKLEDPALAAAGVRMAVLARGKTDGPNEFTLKLDGALDAMDEAKATGGVDVVDGSGKSVRSGYSRAVLPGKRELQFTLAREVGDDLSLKVYVMVGQKAEAVTFDLKDVPLP